MSVGRLQGTEPTDLLILKKFHYTNNINTPVFNLFTIFDLL